MATKARKNGNNCNRNSNNGVGRNKRLFLEKYPDYGSIGATLRAIGIKSRRTFYNWRDSDPHFKEVYETELLPNRRDELISEMYRIARGEMKATDVQVRALFGFLKATDHADTGPDRLVFTERYQHEMMGKDGGPMEVEVDVKGKLISLLDRLAARTGEATSDTEPEPEGS
jgi:hypothetical protein